MTIDTIRSTATIEISAADGDRTLEIQRAISALSRSTGGRVALMAGRHVCGALELLSGVELHLRKGAVLCPRPNYEDYEGNCVSVIAENSDRAMIVARGATNIAVTGTGKIEGGGRHYILGEDDTVGTFLPAEQRPRVIVFEGCEDVAIKDLCIADSPMWTIHLVRCNRASIAGIQIRNNEKLPNTDGIVLDACANTRVDDCDISTADDGICLKTSRPSNGSAADACRDIAIKGCTVRSQSCALKIGTESFGDIRNVVFEDCKVAGSNRALGIFSRDGGVISDIRFSRIELDCTETPDGFWGSGEALTVTIVDRIPSVEAGAVTGLVAEDITGRMEGAVTLISTSASRISHVRLSRIALRQEVGSLGTSDRYDLRPTNADVVLDLGSRGRANAWRRGVDGLIVGLLPYPGGKPGIFVNGASDVAMEEVEIARPQQLPRGWNDQTVVFG